MMETVKLQDLYNGNSWEEEERWRKREMREGVVKLQDLNSEKVKPQKLCSGTVKLQDTCSENGWEWCEENEEEE